MTRALAQGTFDIVHPGHIHYLREAKSMADELYVIVARRSNVTHKQAPILSDEQRWSVVSALEPVDEAVLGDNENFLRPVRKLDPDIIVLGHDQHHDEEKLKAALESVGVNADIRRASPKEPHRCDELVLSSSDIIEQILRERHHPIDARSRVIWPEHTRI